ncbi:circularly permuted type 2 ATP-grasp protein [Alcanivorax sp. JB21]|uniref:circularly permuted type 2 ATP-grasp protein n=1 Tax=Alcanivorax limicola TaxID=2874102 RepID=UPI001CC097A5|nr:circularly permuted type 2 ATP-grasp protein [Alcanivorax limicola]MBZ2187465.1 circularly permuted type 2 ATP-grasp protein [Alcanivorax limicola]
MIKASSPPAGGYDEMFASGDKVRDHYAAYWRWLEGVSMDTVERKRKEADLLFHRVGITFNVYGEDEGTERLIPFDSVPRVIPASEWALLEQGILQRVRAMNMFLHDIYHEQRIIRDGRIPAAHVFANAHYQPCMQGIDLPNDVYAHIAGVDLIRNNDGDYYVLEDNLRTPSGVSYMIENRRMMMRLYPELFARHRVAPVDHYPAMLHEMLEQSCHITNPCVALLTPGRYNSAYFEHAFLARQMGIELVEGADLFTRDGVVYMRTTAGPQRVDVIYRRVDDDYLDPLAFHPDSMLGVPGLMTAYREGNVILANAVGTGVADDKSIYPFVPEMIRFYLSEEPILKNVPTWLCREPDDLKYVMAHLPELVVKEVHGAGGYGMLIGPASTTEQIEQFRSRVLANPDNYIAQPTLSLSSCPIFVEEGIAPRHIDLRPFVLSGREMRLVAGGLTRVAMKEGSLVVNSSQGGGTKDTWVLEAPPC